MKKWFRLMDLALLGVIAVHLILWQWLLVCAGSPLKRGSLHEMTSTAAAFDDNNNNLQSDDNFVDHSKHSNNRVRAPAEYEEVPVDSDDEIMTLSNNVSYEISTKSKKSEISHVFNNYVRDISQRTHDGASKSQISSIYEIFFINNQSGDSHARIDRSAQFNPKINNSKSKRVKGGGGGGSGGSRASTLDRNERSANLSHITGSARKIQLYIKNRFLQLMPDGTVNGTTDDLSDYTILQRTTVNVGQIKIQGVATCLFLCMDSCGFSYGSVEFSDDCIFNESMEQHHYNTYSSTRHSNAKRTFYLGLNRHGQPRKIQLPTSRQLGKLATYTKSLTQTVAHERVDQLITRLYGANHLRHGLKQLCDTGRVTQTLKIKESPKRGHKCGGGGGGKAGGQQKKRQQQQQRKKKKCEAGATGQQHCHHQNNQQQQHQQSSKNGSSSINGEKNAAAKKKVNSQKKCTGNGSNEECKGKAINSNNNNNNGKKNSKLAKKSGPIGSSSGSGTGSSKQQQQQQRVKKKAAKSIFTTTSKPDDEYIEHDVADSSLEEDEDYDEMNTDVDRDTTNFNSENQYE